MLTRRVAVATLTLLLACGQTFNTVEVSDGSLSDEPATPEGASLVRPSGDARDTGDGSDADPGANTGDNLDGGPPCRTDEPFGAPMLVENVNSSAAESPPWLSSDELTMTYSSRRLSDGGGGAYQVYVANRAARTDKFSVGVPLRGQDNLADNIVGSLSGDGLTVFLSSSATGTLGAHDIFVGTRPNVQSAFTRLTPAASVNSIAEDLSPVVTPNGSAVYFSSNRDVASFKMFRAKTGAAGTLRDVSAVTELNGTWDTGRAVPGDDELTLYFESAYPAGRYRDIWMARRASLDVAFDPLPTSMTELNSTANDAPGWVSADGCRMYLTSDRRGGLGDMDIYVAERPR